MRKRLIIIAAAAVIAVASVTADAAGGQKTDEIQTTIMTIRPAPEPDPALQFRLEPDLLLEQTEGNAADAYKLIFKATEGKRLDSEFFDPINEWLEAPGEPLPADEVRTMLAALPMAELRRASRMERCDWNLLFRRDAIYAQLPPLGHMRNLAKATAIQARMLAEAGDFDAAIDSLQTGFSMARHAAASPHLISKLVGVAIASIMLEEVQHMAAMGGSPNMYWALAALPRPFIDWHDALQGEGAFLYTHALRLRPGEREKLTGAEWTEEMRKFAASLHELGAELQGAELQIDGLASAGGPLGLTVWCLLYYGPAKEYLADHGRTAEQIEAMSVAQAVGLYLFEEFDHWRDEMLKWMYLPYWQAHEYIGEADKALRNLKSDPLAAVLPRLLLYNIGRAFLHDFRLRRHIAALQCIEAIRMYAAAHEGRLPAKLSDIRAVPLPLNPVTGEPFGYRVDGDKASLDAPAPAGYQLRDSRLYEITLTQ